MPQHEIEYGSDYVTPAAEEAVLDRKEALRPYLDALASGLDTQRLRYESVDFWSRRALVKRWLKRPELAPFYLPRDDAYYPTLYQQLGAMICQHGYPVVEFSATKGEQEFHFHRTNGLAMPSGETLIWARLSAPKKISVLMHELGHHLLHANVKPDDSSLSARVRLKHLVEIQAEGVSHVVCAALGVNYPTRNEFAEMMNLQDSKMGLGGDFQEHEETILDTAAVILEQVEHFSRVS